MLMNFRNTLPVFIIVCLISFCSCSKEVSFWNKDKLEKAVQYSKEIGTFSMVIQTNGEIVASFGDIDSLSRTHSIRKAILMAIVSQHLDKIDLESTLADLNIDDRPVPLTELQKTAKVIHLIKSISGINHPAVSQVGNAQLMRDSLLGKNSNNVPGTKWAYNNWDYNALTTILEQETGLTLSQAFEEGIAKPLGIERFGSIHRQDSSLSIHAKTGFRLSTRDMAKFGQLFLNKGYWDGKVVVPESWIENITNDYVLSSTPNSERFAHGYLWWLPSESYAGGIPKGSYMTTGTAGQRILVIPEWNTVIAHKVMTEIPSKQRTPVSRSEFEKLVELIRESKN